MRLEAHPTPRGGQLPEFDFNDVTPDYFRAAGISLRAGRAFTDGDRAGAPLVAVVDSAAAARYWPERRDVIGQRMQSVVGSTWVTVVGVVGSVRRGGLDADVGPTIYFPVAQSDPLKAARLVVRGDEAAFGPAGLVALRNAVRRADASAPVGTPRPLAAYVAESTERRRFTAALAALFAGAALALGAVGVYGVVAYAAAARTRELGVRAALGATAGDLRGLVLADGGRLAGWGAAVGILAALASGRLLGGLLYGVSPADPVVLLAVPLVLAGVTLAAAALPARRAARVDPLVAMRAE